VKVGLINLCKGLFSLNARIYYSIAHRQAVCNLPGGCWTILPHKGVYCSNWFLSDDARWACLEESIARSLTVISLLLQSTTHCRYRVNTKFLLTYTAIYRRNRKVLPLGITALQPQSHFHLGTPYRTELKADPTVKQYWNNLVEIKVLLRMKYKIAGYHNHGGWWGYQNYKNYFLFSYVVVSSLVHFS
jgi:hypothetical protein